MTLNFYPVISGLHVVGEVFLMDVKGSLYKVSLHGFSRIFALWPRWISEIGGIPPRCRHFGYYILFADDPSRYFYQIQAILRKFANLLANYSVMRRHLVVDIVATNWRTRFWEQVRYCDLVLKTSAWFRQICQTNWMKSVSNCLFAGNEAYN